MDSSMIQTPIAPFSRFGTDMWVDEAIWGHRFYNDQTPWLLLLEFLCVFNDQHNRGIALSGPPDDGTHETIGYQILKSTPVRELVFNCPELSEIDEEFDTNTRKWNEWEERINAENRQFYLQLRKKVPEFSHLCRIVNYFKSSAVEPHRNRRWTSKFIFPYGPDCLFSDMRSRKNTFDADRRFFARGGELLYLMMNRSQKREMLKNVIADKILQKSETWNSVIACISDVPDYINFENIGYLPYAQRPEYEHLAETWIQILQLNLTGQSLIDPLMRLTALHILIYLINRANEEIGNNDKPKFVIEIAAPGRSSLFELSNENFKGNSNITSSAINSFVSQVSGEEKWLAAVTSGDSNSARQILKEKFYWSDQDSRNLPPNRLLEKLQETAKARHKQHLAKVHGEWSRQIGLTAARRGLGTWYSPSDSLLKALVMGTVVGKRMEFHEFLEVLYKRFGLVIGFVETEEAYGNLPIDQNIFHQNIQRLEARLKILGLLERLSDDCAYVVNRFYG